MIKEVYMKAIIAIVTVLLLSCIVSPITSRAADKIDWVKLYKENRELYIKLGTCTDEESQAEGVYSEYAGVDTLKDAAVTKGASKEVKQKYKKTKGTYQFGQNGESKYITRNKGYVYGNDELHVTGTPADPETGYTLPGDYTNVPIDGEGTFVGGQDEVHIGGAPTRSDGYTAAGLYK